MGADNIDAATSSTAEEPGAATIAEVTPDNMIREFEQARSLAVRRGQASAAVTLPLAKARLAGLLNEILAAASPCEPSNRQGSKALSDSPDKFAKRLKDAAPQVRDEAAGIWRKSTRHILWTPNDGPQRDAYECEADELFYGGQAGGGKTELGLGLALTVHKRSLILRRINKDALKLAERVAEIFGHRTGYNGQLPALETPQPVDRFSGCEHEDDKQRFKGDPYDLIYFDEGTDFLVSQYRFIIGWNRSADEKQRCRVVVGSKPADDAEGLWVIRALVTVARSDASASGASRRAALVHDRTGRRGHRGGRPRVPISSMVRTCWHARAPTSRLGWPTIPICTAPVTPQCLPACRKNCGGPIATAISRPA